MIKSTINYEYFCDEVLAIDNMIRFVGIFVNDEFYSKMQEGKKSRLTEEEVQKSLRHGILRWKSSELFSAKTGKLRCQVAKYDHLFQITLPLSDSVMCLMSTESNVDPFKIAEKVTEIKKRIL
jgi:hypothetical protein